MFGSFLTGPPREAAQGGQKGEQGGFYNRDFVLCIKCPSMQAQGKIHEASSSFDFFILVASYVGMPYIESNATNIG
jgi:hypothetical protein